MKEHQSPWPFGQRAAVVSQAQAVRLIDYDHHRVWVGGTLDVMLAYQWQTGEATAGVRVLIVVFPPVSVVQAHPAAPAEIQVVIDQLVFG